MSHNAPGKAFRTGISLIQLMDVFPTEDAAREWFEGIYWPDGRRCGHCDGTRTRPTKSGKPMPYWCAACRKYFSVKTGTAMADSNIPLRKWAIGIYLCLTSLKSVSSMKLHRDLGIGQKAAWFMLHRLREAWASELGGGPFDGPIEVDETYIGGRRENMPKAKREALAGTGHGPVGKAPVKLARALRRPKPKKGKTPQEERRSVMKLSTILLAACLVASPVSAFDGGWGEPIETDPYGWGDFAEPTVREPVDPTDFLPDGHEEALQREYENRQYRQRLGPCAGLYDNNPAAKDNCYRMYGR